MKIRTETTRAIFGIDGTAQAVTTWDGCGSTKNPDAIASQKWTARRAYDKGTLTVELRFDDSCKNGSQSFAITGEYRERGRLEACGCLHDDIAEAFP